MRFDLVALDTDILVSLLQGKAGAIEKITTLQEGGARLCTTVITVYELVKGAHISSNATENLMKVSEVVSSLRILDLSFGACEEAARIHRELKDRGKMIGEFDILIAGIVKFYDETLVTQNAHFKAVRTLKTAGW